MKLNYFIIAFSILFFTQNVNAQAPTWTVNPNQFQYSMSVTAVIELNCGELTHPSNQIGAFVNDTLRGTAFTSTVINGRYQANMLVYSNLANGETVSFKFYDQNTNQVYNGVNDIAFQDNAIYGSPSVPFIVGNNNQASSIALTSTNLTENRPVGTFIGKLSTVDADNGQTHTYSLASGSGSVDNSSFSLSNDSLFSNVIANYGVKTFYTIRLRTTDNLGCSLDSVFQIDVVNINDAPTAINLSSSLVNENNTLNSVVSFLSAIDVDPNETFTYALVAGTGDTDNGSFSVLNNQLIAGQVFDFETQDTFRIRLRVTDGAANVYEQAMLIRIIDVNEAPSDLSISSDSIAENLAINSIVGTLSTTDQDGNQTFSYSFDPVAGNDNAFFNIVGNSLRSKAIFDFETLPTYVICIQARDQGGLTFTKQFIIRITDANDNPSDVLLSNNSVDENQAIGAFIGKFTAADVDQGSTFSYSLVNGVGDADNARFQILNDTLFSNQVFSFNAKNSHSIRVQVSDNAGGTFSKPFTIAINDVNNAPTDLFLSNPIILENTARGSTVGFLSSQDPDQNDTHTYTLVSGAGDADNGSFIIFNNNLLTDTTFNVNLQSSYSIRIRTTDAQGLTFEKAIGLTITNSNDAPTNITLSPDTLLENVAINTLVGNLSTVDPDINDTHTYSFVNLTSNDNGNFAILGSELRTAGNFDYETKSAYVVQLQTDDGNGGVYAKQLFVNIKDTNDIPTGILLSANQVNEKQTVDQWVGNLTTVDQDAIDNFTYSLVSGAGSTDNADFRIANDSLYATGNFDVLVKSQLSIRVQTADKDGKIFAKAFSISVQDINDAPNGINLSNASIPENTSLNTNVGLLSSLDIDPNQTFTYSLVAGTGDIDNADFIISGDQLKTNTLFNYNAQKNHSIRIRTTDQGGLFFEQVFNITISNSNDAPTNIAVSPNSFNENLPQGTVVANFTTTDADSTDIFSYSFVNQGSNDNASFIISGDELRTAAQFDYESKNLYIIEVQTRDLAGATYNRQLTLSILDTNDAPTAIAISADTLTEKSPVGSYVADISTTDVDATDNHIYTIVPGQGSADNGLFRINGNLLEIDSVLNFNDKASRNVRIRSTDKDGLFVEATFRIRIRNTNDAPTDLLLSDTIANENDIPGTRIAILSTLDEDPNDSFTYSLIAGSGDADNASFMIVGNTLQNMINFDYESQATFSIRLRTTDNAGASFEKVFTIRLSDGNEAPVISAQKFTVKENLAIGATVGQLQASDADAGDLLSYRIVGDQLNFNVESNGLIKTSRRFDYEVANTYSIIVEVRDLAGLTDTTTVSIIIEDQIEKTLPAASYFSPNGDGKNDFWSIQNVSLYSDYKLTIFSASGEVVYSISSNYNNNWDGTFGGEELPEGIYFYYFEDSADTANNFKGTITLKR